MLIKIIGIMDNIYKVKYRNKNRFEETFNRYYSSKANASAAILKNYKKIYSKNGRIEVKMDQAKIDDDNIIDGLWHITITYNDKHVNNIMDSKTTYYPSCIERCEIDRNIN